MSDDNRKIDRRSKFHGKKKNNKFSFDEDKRDQYKLNKQFKHKKQSIKEQEEWEELDQDEF